MDASAGISAASAQRNLVTSGDCRMGTETPSNNEAAGATKSRVPTALRSLLILSVWEQVAFGRTRTRMARRLLRDSSRWLGAIATVLPS